MKRINKDIVLGLVMGTIITGTISVGAATYFSADQIKFAPTDESWKVDNAQDAMNDLFNNQQETISGLNDQINNKQTDIDNLNSTISNGKSTIANALINKGISTSPTATFEEMATKIGQTSSKILFPFTVSVASYRYATINISSIADYQNLTMDNIYVINVTSSFPNSTLGGAWTGFVYPKIESYDATTGTVTMREDSPSSQRERTYYGTLLILK